MSTSHQKLYKTSRIHRKILPHIKSKKKIEEITTGNTIKHILASDMQEFVVDITNYDEQKKIGSYFQKLDHRITLHQRKCDEIKEIKKYMLQNMFPKKG